MKVGQYNKKIMCILLIAFFNDYYTFGFCHSWRKCF